MSLASTLDIADIARLLPSLTDRFEFPDSRPMGRPSGFGAVWRAHDRLLDQAVAIKISDSDLSSEVRYCRKIDGHTVRVYDYFERSGWYAYAMELLAEPWTTIDALIGRHDGCDMLQRYLDGFEVIDAVLAALGHIHGVPYSRERRHVHADIQPRNVFVWWQPKGNPRDVFRLRAGRDLVKVIDLGLTVHKGEWHEGRHPHYANPGRDVAHHGHDLYSAAVMFLELVTGVLPSHHTMGHSSRIMDHVIAHSSGSIAIDCIAVEFANEAARAGVSGGPTAARLRQLLASWLFDLPHMHLLALRELVRQQPGPMKKSEMAALLFPVYAKHLGWKNATGSRMEAIQEEVLEMADAGLLVRDGYHYRY